LKNKKNIKIVYFVDLSPLPEVDQFIKEHSQKYNFELLKLGDNFKTETQTLVEKYDMKAIYLGTRRGDPFCGIKSTPISTFASTSRVFFSF
jgi:hypothetical protein